MGFEALLSTTKASELSLRVARARRNRNIPLNPFSTFDLPSNVVLFHEHPVGFREAFVRQ